jgi:hypothetical protein
MGCVTPMVTPPQDAGTVEDAGVDAGVADAGVASLVPVWSATASTPVASGLWGTVLAFDPVDRRFILHGGNTYPTGGVVSDTWSFSIASGQWTKLTTTGAAPPLRYCHCSTFLPNQRQVLIAGGRDSGGLVDSAYTLDLATLEWTQVTGAVPTGAIGCNAHWMPNQARAIVYGGEGMGGVTSNTWAYDPAARTFTLLSPAVPPPGRRDAMSAYEPVNGRMFVFGGAARIMQSYLDDVAIFDGSGWLSTPAPEPHPTRRRYGASGYDAVHARWVLFSGTNDVDDFDDLWVIDPVTFEFTLAPRVTPSPVKRGFAASGIDEVTGALYVFGGLSNPGFTAMSDGWKLQLTER